MKRSGVPILIVGIAAALLLAGDQPHRLVLPASGFSIEVLDCPPGDQVCQPLMMFLPPSDAFAPNVNVQIQPFAGTLNEYLALTRKGLAGMKLAEDPQESRIDAATCTLEYEALVQERELHCYQRVVASPGRVHLATGTALLTQWPQVGAKVRACVDSLRLETMERKP